MEGDEVAIVALVEVDLVVVDVAAIVDFDSAVLALDDVDFEEVDEAASLALDEVDFEEVDVAAIVDFDSPVLAKTVLVWPDAAAHFVPEDEEVFDGCI